MWGGVGCLGDPDVKNGAQLLDRLIKDIVTESDLFDVEKFIPLLQARLTQQRPLGGFPFFLCIAGSGDGP